MKHSSPSRTKQAGFTLVELAIVLVIIGLIVGGVLSGQDLIKSATLQKSIKKINDTNTAVAAFRTKYNALPGDFAGAASAYGTVGGTVAYKIAAVANSAGQGNGDGSIQSNGGTNTSIVLTGEVAAVYPELLNESYFADKLASFSSAGLTLSSATANTPAAVLLPFGLTGTNTPYLEVETWNGNGYISIIGAISTTSGAAGSFQPALTPQQAASIDAKLDDGVPTTGLVLSIATASPVPPTAAAGSCYSGTAYNFGATTQTCSLSIRGSF